MTSFSCITYGTLTSAAGRFEVFELVELALSDRRNMSENCCGVDCLDCGSEGVSALLVNEKGRNKRKFLSDLSIDMSAELSDVSIKEVPRSEDDDVEEQDVDDFRESDWDDPVACQLEELLTNNLYATFCSAVKKIVESGYTEEVAELAVLNSGMFHGNKDAVSNIVDNALAILQREKEFSTTKHPVFEGLQSLVDYTLLEMIYVVREVRPSLTVSEAMWCLLINDLNLVYICVTEGGPAGGSYSQEASGENQKDPQSKSEASGASQTKDSYKSGSAKKILPRDKGCMPRTLSACELVSSGLESSISFEEAKNLLCIGKEHFKISSQGSATEEKSVGNRKGLSINCKRDMLRHKTSNFEKNYKGRQASKGAFKAKVAAWGSMVLDKSLRAQAGCSSVGVKAAHSKLSTSAGTSSSLAEGHNHNSSNSPSLVPSGNNKDTVYSLPAVNSKSCAPSVPDANSDLKGGFNVSDTPNAVDYHASIPFDETLQKYVPQDDKDKAILLLVPHKQDIEKELQRWREWANEKVMQAARRLGKDQAELKMLRQEKEEIEKFKKEKQSFEDSTTKRLSEMEHALSNALGQIEVANCTIRRLEEENDMLKDDMEGAKIQTQMAANSLRIAVNKEQANLKKLQSWEAEKSVVQGQLTKLKREITALDNRLKKATGRKDQFKALWKQEEKEKSKAQQQIDSLRKKLVEEEAAMQVDVEKIKKAAEEEMQKCEADIKKLQTMITELRLESDRSKIAALKGYGTYMASLPGSQLPKVTKRLAVFHDNFNKSPDVKPERECVMCLTEEISVVFTPCAHQVLCGQCNVLHEKRGMNECPSCRTAIQKRVPVTYRGDKGLLACSGGRFLTNSVAS